MCSVPREISEFVWCFYEEYNILVIFKVAIILVCSWVSQMTMCNMWGITCIGGLAENYHLSLKLPFGFTEFYSESQTLLAVLPSTSLLWFTLTTLKYRYRPQHAAVFNEKTLPAQQQMADRHIEQLACRHNEQLTAKNIVFCTTIVLSLTTPNLPSGHPSLVSYPILVT